MRRLALIALPALILTIPASVSAFPLTNCTLALSSVDASNVVIATASAGAADATQEDPFFVDWDGTVQWAGTMGSLVIKDHSWSVSIFNIPTPLSGGDPNEGGDTDGDGTVKVGENLPFEITGLFYVSGAISGDGGSCSGSGWMRLRGDAFGTIPFWIGLALIVLGLLMLWMGARGSAAWAVSGGILLGLGGAVMLIIYAVMPIGSWTPLATLLAGLGIGIGVAVMRRRPATA
jgi:hypothetical protein